MRNSVPGILFTAVFIATPAMAQQQIAAPLGVRPEDTRSYIASASASLRAVALCSGLWSGGQTRELIERRILPPAGDLRTQIDETRRIVQVTYSASMPPRIVVWRTVLGCVQLPAGATLDDARYVPQVSSRVRAPNLDDQPWPTGDRNATVEIPPGRKSALDRLVDAAFDGKTYGGNTWGVIVVKDGKILAERYDPDFGVHIGHQTHSAAKSFASSLVGIATRKYRLDIKRPGALREWRKAGDPRGRITVEHMLHMSSGLYGEGGGSPQSDIYFQGDTVEGRAVTNHLDSLPGTRFLYNPPDTMLLMRAVRQAVNDDQRFLAYPFQELFWKIGMTRTITSSDWNGERILPEGGARYVATPGPVQPSGDGPRYGAQFWLYGGQAGLPPDAFSPNGGQGQYAMIIPSRNVVVVRRGIDEASGFQIARFASDVLEALGQ